MGVLSGCGCYKVEEANMTVAMTVLNQLYLIARHAIWIVEQPGSLAVPHADRVGWLMERS